MPRFNTKKRCSPHAQTIKQDYKTEKTCVRLKAFNVDADSKKHESCKVFISHEHIANRGKIYDRNEIEQGKSSYGGTNLYFHDHI